jgi:hypothetical protein
VHFKNDQGDDEMLETVITTNRLLEFTRNSPDFDEIEEQILMPYKERTAIWEYIKEHTQVNEEERSLNIERYEVLEDATYITFRTDFVQALGCGIKNRVHPMSLSDQEVGLKDAINKQLILNKEIELSETILDVKLYEVQDRDQRRPDAILIEIFILSEPDIYFTFTYSLSNSQSFNN